jgi:hypothetical protein
MLSIWVFMDSWWLSSHVVQIGHMLNDLWHCEIWLMSKRKCSNYIASIWYLGGLYRHVKISHGVLYPKKNNVGVCMELVYICTVLSVFIWVFIYCRIILDHLVILKNSKLLAESWFISCELLASTWQLSNAFIASRAVDECPLPNAP